MMLGAGFSLLRSHHHCGGRPPARQLAWPARPLRHLAHQREIVATVELATAVDLFALLADQVGALLGIGALERGVLIDAVLLEVIEGKRCARARVDRGGAKAGTGGDPADRGASVTGDDTERID